MRSLIRRLPGCLALSLVLCTSIPASAADLPPGGATLDEVTVILRDLGYVFAPATDSSGTHILKGRVGTTNTDVYLYSCRSQGGDSRCTEMQFAAGFVLKTVTLSTINSWNQTKRYGRAYLSNAGDPFMEMDIDISTGATRAQMGAYTKHLESLLTQFRTAIGYPG
jgi:hypothetical protein